MSYERQMLSTIHRSDFVSADALVAAIDALSDCSQACSADTSADLGEQDLAEMVTCIRLCLDCTDICDATLAVLSRITEPDPKVTKPLLESCVAICDGCGDECERHAKMYEHCRVCGEACRRCERACKELLTAIS
jgi:hypothetical protein